MKISEHWLREWINPRINTHELAEQLTMAGLEVDSITPVAGEFNKVIIGKVIAVEPHPKAERLTVCQVEVGQSQTLMIVCGAANVRERLKVAVAMIGATLPDGRSIQATKLRDVASQGMICSAHELGLQEGPDDKIMELPKSAPIGEDLNEYLKLKDHSLDIHITPNRGDCLSIAGMAREIATLNDQKFSAPAIEPVTATIKDQSSVKVDVPESCPRYLGRVIRGINSESETPIWLRERLRRSGVRSIHPVVDVTNYVLLELGQPLHAFDLAKLKGGINVRFAKANEKIVLLNGQEIVLDKNILVIADAEQAHAIAGIMGGAASAVSESSSDIFLECAFFNPITIAGRARQYGLSTDSSYRFERGIDFEMQRRALERATQLLVEIVGGQVGPITEVVSEKNLPKTPTILLQKDRIVRLLGISIPDEQVDSILHQLGMTVQKNSTGWEISPPKYRYDINIAEDLIEELARIYGYFKIPNKQPKTDLVFLPQTENQINLKRVRHLLIDRGYHEAITYSFASPKWQSLIAPDEAHIKLINPISHDLSVMRASLWSGLLTAVVYNQNRQQPRVRLFELGLRFLQSKNSSKEISQEMMIAGVITGNAYPEQWGISNRASDFYDIKNDIEELFNLSGKINHLSCRKTEHPALHMGQSCAVYLHDELVGYVGALHPALLQAFDLLPPVFLFELKLDSITKTTVPNFQALSKFPAIRRDISFWVDASIPVQDICDAIRQSAGDLLVDLCLFDVYQGKKADAKQRSLAMGLLLQHPDRTLVDDEVNKLMDRVISSLKDRFAITQRVE